MTRVLLFFGETRDGFALLVLNPLQNWLLQPLTSLAASSCSRGNVILEAFHLNNLFLD